MSVATIGAPYSFATLPKPLDTTSGGSSAAAVYGHRAGKKRKRHEIAVGIDGESLNIYNVQTQNLVTSYALPAQTYLCCPPVSIHVRTDTKSTARRETYAVVKDSPKASKRRLICINEDVSVHADVPRGSGLGLRKPSIKEVEVAVRGTVVGLDAISNDDAEASSVILIASSEGDVAVFDTRTGQISIEQVVDSKDDNRAEVRFSTAMSVETAQSSVLKNRGDISAMLQQSMHVTPNSTPVLVCQVVAVSDSEEVRFYAGTASSDPQDKKRKPDLQLLLASGLPQSRITKSMSAQYSLHAPSSMLYRLGQSGLTILDLSSPIIKIQTEIGSEQGGCLGFARTTSSSIFTIGKDSASLYETFYGSTLASRPLRLQDTFSSDERKRKRDDQREQGEPAFATFSPISSFADLGLVVGLSEGELKAFQFNDTTRGSKRAKTTLLKDVMIKSDLDSNCTSRKTKLDESSWSDWKQKVDGIVTANNFSELEDLIFNDKNLSFQVENVSDSTTKTNGTANGEGAADESVKSAPMPLSRLKIDKRKLSYLLQAVFEISYGGLSIRCGSPGLLAWIAHTGHLSAGSLGNSLARGDAHSGDIFKALAKFDSSFEVMGRLLALPVQWDFGELVQGLDLLLRSFRAPLKADGLLALPAPPAHGDESELSLDDPESQLLREAEAAQQELDLTSAFFDNGLQVRREVLNMILSRLASCSQKQVISVMRSALTHEDLFLLIELMRVELAFGGWTSQYVDDGNDIYSSAMVNSLSGDDEGRPNDHAVKAIGDLLNCAVDAIGPHGWLVGLSGHAQQAGQLLEGLSAEISACLQGCVEASTVADFLQVLEKCSCSSRETLRARDESDPEQQLLPLGGRFEPPALPGPFGHVKKSKIAKAQEKSRTVGKYSIDRIRI